MNNNNLSIFRKLFIGSTDKIFIIIMIHFIDIWRKNQMRWFFLFSDRSRNCLDRFVRKANCQLLCWRCWWWDTNHSCYWRLSMYQLYMTKKAAPSNKPIAPPPLFLSSPVRFSTASIANEKVIFKCSRPKMLLRNCIIAFAHLPDCSPLSQRFSIQFLLSRENVSLRKKGWMERRLMNTVEPKTKNQQETVRCREMVRWRCGEKDMTLLWTENFWNKFKLFISPFLRCGDGDKLIFDGSMRCAADSLRWNSVRQQTALRGKHWGCWMHVVLTNCRRWITHYWMICDRPNGNPRTDVHVLCDERRMCSNPLCWRDIYHKILYSNCTEMISSCCYSCFCFCFDWLTVSWNDFAVRCF